MKDGGAVDIRTVIKAIADQLAASDARVGAQGRTPRQVQRRPKS